MFFSATPNLFAYPENIEVIKKLTWPTLTRFGSDILGKLNIRRPLLDLLIVMGACYLLPAIWVGAVFDYPLIDQCFGVGTSNCWLTNCLCYIWNQFQAVRSPRLTRNFIWQQHILNFIDLKFWWNGNVQSYLQCIL